MEFDLAQIEWAMEESIRIVRWIDPAKMHMSYKTVEEDGNDECPEYDEEYYEENDGERYHWRDACSVSSGGSFAGYAYTYDYGEPTWVPIFLLTWFFYLHANQSDPGYLSKDLKVF